MGTPTTSFFAPGKPLSKASRSSASLITSSSIVPLPKSIKAVIPRILVPPDPTTVIQSLKTGATQSLSQKGSSAYTSPSASFYALYETYILDMVQFITDKMSLDAVLDNLRALQVQIQTKAQAQRVIQQIEEILLGVVENITNRVSLDIVLGRLAYLTELLNTVDPRELPAVYGDVADLLITVIDEVANKTSLDIVLTDLGTIQTGMAADTMIAREILDFQEIVISIVENIIHRVSLDIVMGRLVYLRGKLTTFLP